METPEQTAATNVYWATRAATTLAAKHRAGTIDRYEGHDLLAAIEVISRHTEIPGRVLWLQMVDEDPMADRTYAAELLNSPGLAARPSPSEPIRDPRTGWLTSSGW